MQTEQLGRRQMECRSKSLRSLRERRRISIGTASSGELSGIPAKQRVGESDAFFREGWTALSRRFYITVLLQVRLTDVVISSRDSTLSCSITSDGQPVGCPSCTGPDRRRLPPTPRLASRSRWSCRNHSRLRASEPVDRKRRQSVFGLRRFTRSQKHGRLCIPCLTSGAQVAD